MSFKKIGLSFLVGTLAQFARADISAQIAEASAPLTQGGSSGREVAGAVK